MNTIIKTTNTALEMRNIFLAIAVLISTVVCAQTQTENYVKTTAYQKAVKEGEEYKVLESDKVVSVNYFDGLGRAKQSVAVRAGGQTQSTNILDWTTDWTLGTGHTATYNMNGQSSDNERIFGTNPFGEQSMLWRCGNDAARDGDGGWNTDYFSVDKNVGYRYMVWVKRTGSQDGMTYHGTHNVNHLNGTSQDNPYFWAGDLPQLDTWYLMVGYIHPHTYTGGNSGISGVYDMNGTRVKGGNDFKWRSNTVNANFRSYLYYAVDTSVRQYFWNPQIIQSNNSQSIKDYVKYAKPRDIVTYHEYDDLGRKTKEYLSYAAASTKKGDIYTNPLAELNAFYNTSKYENTTNPYTESVLEASPLNRTLEQGAPGASWKANPESDADHTIKFDWQTNTTADAIPYFKVTFSNPHNTHHPNLRKEGTYSEGQLYISITKDENWASNTGNDHTIREYKNKKGQVILKRTFNANGERGVSGFDAHDTYYVYDDYGNLTYVIPPKVNVTDGVSPAELSELCYQYIYDYRNRLIQKKIPGKGREYILYNKLDQPVLTQDVNQRSSKQWTFTKYDAFGRVIYTGLYTSGNLTSEQIQQQIDQNPLSENNGSPHLIGGTYAMYTNNSFPKTNIELLTINYYDGYQFYNDALPNPGTVFGITVTNKLKGLPGNSKVKVLSTGKWIHMASYYDDKGRVIATIAKNDYLNTIDIVEMELDFTGKVLKSQTIHSKDNNPLITTIDNFTYDHMGRQLTHTQKINDRAVEMIASNVYDELGQVVQKKVGNSEVSPLQTIDYTYNIRGWLKGINDTAALGDDLFGFGINYDQVTENTARADALYNGNISETIWKTANDNTKRSYSYGYDAINRLTDAYCSNGSYNLTNVRYDKNGNILSLTRNGHRNEETTSFGVMDNLVYSYRNSKGIDQGNKLMSVTDQSNISTGFNDGNTFGDDYAYDANGNLTKDLNKQISEIRYNHLNLPIHVQSSREYGPPGSTMDMLYRYDATGTKLVKEATGERGGRVLTQYAGNYVYDLFFQNWDPGVSSRTKLKFFNHAEGYVEPVYSDGRDGTQQLTGFTYIYQYKDHLGNVRLSYADRDGDYQNILASSFTDDKDGWQDNGAANSVLENGRTKVTVDKSWEGLRHSLSDFAVQSGDKLTVQLTFDKGNTNANVRLYIQELDANGNHLSWNILESNLSTGTYSYPYTVKTGKKIVLRIDKNNTHEDQTTYFYVDEVKLSKGELTIKEEKNYYPFGLEHKGYNNRIVGREYNWNFQGQEHTEDLELNVHEFRWRIHDPAIGRFWQVDPLAEKFVYNSTYAFSENKVISHFELEGLEAVLAITLGNDVKYRGDILERAHPNTQHTNIQSGGINSFVNAFRNASASDPNGIGFAAIWGHGVPGNIWGSGSSGNTDISTSDLSVLNDAIKNGEINFTSSAIIYMGNCNGATCGSSDTRSFAAELSKITGATVIGGNASVGVGPDGSQIENPESMIYWMYNPNVDRFISFVDGVPTMMDGSTDVIRHLNRAMNPPTSVNSLTPNGITPSITPAPTGTTQQGCPDCDRKRREAIRRAWNYDSQRLHDNDFIKPNRY